MRSALAIRAALLLSGLCVGHALAEATRYVVDELSVTVRTGQGKNYAIVKVLHSGDAVRVLGTDEESGYAQVRLADGTEGYMLVRYLQAQRIARQRLPELESRLAQLEAENARLQQRADRMQSAGQGAEGHAEALEQELEALHEEVILLRRGAARRWAIWGAATVLLSLLIGFGLGRRGQRRW